MTDKETIESLALQIEQLSEDVRGLTYTVQDLVAIIGIESVEHDKFGLIRTPSNAGVCIRCVMGAGISGRPSLLFCIYFLKSLIFYLTNLI